MANSLSSFKSDHKYVTGIAIVTVGVLGVLGSVTGNLPAMLAALFAPDILTNAKGQQADNPENTAGTAITAVGGAGIATILGPLSWIGNKINEAG